MDRLKQRPRTPELNLKPSLFVAKLGFVVAIRLNIPVCIFAIFVLATGDHATPLQYKANFAIYTKAIWCCSHAWSRVMLRTILVDQIATNITLLKMVL